MKYFVILFVVVISSVYLNASPAGYPDEFEVNQDLNKYDEGKTLGLKRLIRRNRDVNTASRSRRNAQSEFNKEHPECGDPQDNYD